MDGDNSLLQLSLSQHSDSLVILAVAAFEGMDYLPWETLHDGNDFLVNQNIIPVRWLKSRNIRSLTINNQQPSSRALKCIFMACSPRDTEIELDFEGEEAKILQETNSLPLSLTVEESGSLRELGNWVTRYDFDIIHLSAHGGFSDEGEPCLLTENEFGNVVYSTAQDIATQIKFTTPRLIFLSGCQTGYSRFNDTGFMPSMAATLSESEGKAVLGWADSVSDRDASFACGTLYRELSRARTVTEALTITYQEMLKQELRDWHKLRLYVTKTLPGALVERGHFPPPHRTFVRDFIDDRGALRVATRETFVGRRRYLQDYLRVLQTSQTKVTIFIHGMGGNGKSTIASRLCDRLSETFEPIIFPDRNLQQTEFREEDLINRLVYRLVDPNFQELQQDLRNSERELKLRLTYVFQRLNKLGRRKRFLFVLDEFEWSLEYRQGEFVLQPQVYEVLSALVNSIQTTGDRIIITCRHQFSSPLLQFFFKLPPLPSLSRSALQKKLNRLNNFNSSNIDSGLKTRALQLADGNPRLLEWLNSEVLSINEPQARLNRLTQLEKNPQEWQEQVIWNDFCDQIQADLNIQEIISYCLVLEIPVPRSVLEAVCASRSDYQTDYQNQLNRVERLGLIEGINEPEQLYRVSRILPHIFPAVRQCTTAPLIYSLYQIAYEQLRVLWGNCENTNKLKWRELFRLLLANQQNPARFREGFCHMLDVQYNDAADRILQHELTRIHRQLKSELSLTDELSCDNFCHQLEQLEIYLGQENWKKADEETAWIFYLIKVLKARSQDFSDWEDVFKNIPIELLDEIDRLWIQHSNERFGFRVQKRIWENTPGQNDDRFLESFILKRFGKQIGWSLSDNYDQWISCRKDEFFEELKIGSLPALLYTRTARIGYGWTISEEGGWKSPWDGFWRWDKDENGEVEFEYSASDVDGGFNSYMKSDYNSFYRPWIGSFIFSRI